MLSSLGTLGWERGGGVFTVVLAQKRKKMVFVLEFRAVIRVRGRHQFYKILEDKIV